MSRLLGSLAVTITVLLFSAGTPALATSSVAVSPTSWASVTSKHQNQAHWVEYQPTWDGDDDAPVGRTAPPPDITRSFFQIDISKYADTRILTAYLALQVREGSDCEPGIELWETESISPETTWKHQPRWLRKLYTVPVLPCPRTYLEWDAIEAVTEAAARGDKFITFGLKSADETVPGRHLFRTSPFRGSTGPGLVLKYNTRPDVPSEFLISNQDCHHPLPAGPYLRTTTPSLLATLTDPDTDGGDVLRARFEWADTGGNKIDEATSGEQRAGYQHCVTVPAGQLADGGSYTWRVRAENRYRVLTPDGYQHRWDLGEWSAWQPEFTLDTTPPGKPPVISSTDFPENQVGGRVGLPGTFTVTSNGVTDVTAFEYMITPISSWGTIPAGSDGAATITFTPVNLLTQKLTVRSVDRAGNPGPSATYSFRVRSAAPPIISSTTYPPGDTGGGGVGVPGEFVFGTNGVTDAVTFHYQLMEQAVDVPVGPDGFSAVTITPNQAGTQQLTVSMLSAAGVRISAATYSFTVKS
ncbi:hypothetical protein ETD86_23125 [Nonomuraea turkmeniaca]|uniref:DNRLRE domain-containing protein n=1 Tax=Nonomuraea turkmeniaca TaxID=103838 RepID=A0A5S4FFI7_9ACTN|nr:hypothetical protein [Nonomuraea turkmeniaca]TMR17521.1 hypothetical protein ETD86_23125 [Nonomuraea turkmeniaca]